jgi:DNA mismatch repair protein MutS
VRAVIDDLPLFATAAQPDPPADPLAVLLDQIAPDELSPREALEALYKLKAARKKGM